MYPARLRPPGKTQRRRRRHGFQETQSKCRARIRRHTSHGICSGVSRKGALTKDQFDGRDLKFGDLASVYPLVSSAQRTYQRTR